MNFPNLTNIKEGPFGIILTFLLIILTVSITVDTLNKIKEGKYIGQGAENKTTISVSGTGEIFANPDLAIVDLAVITEGKTSTLALQENSSKMNAVIDIVKKQGIDEKDIKTTGLNIYPRYEYQKQTVPTGGYYPPEGTRTLVGYEVQQTLNLKIRELERVGQIIESATAAGANQMNNLQFTIEKEDDLKIQARESAIQKAKDAAKKLADQLGVKLVRIISFNENYYLPYFYSMKETSGMGGGTTAPQIEPGQNKISVSVNMVYEIN